MPAYDHLAERQKPAGRSYANPWIPAAAQEILAKHTGSLLDVGGGAAPHVKASWILDVLPFADLHRPRK